MNTVKIPSISEAEKMAGLQLAAASVRRRFAKILHQPGSDFNEVFNFMMEDTYMQPHLHPGDEKIEMIYLVHGELAVLFFDNKGVVIKCILLNKEGVDMIAVPAFTWHTYVMLSPSVITYETMMGKYDPQTWKDFFTIAPEENTDKSIIYLESLKIRAKDILGLV